MPLQSATPPLYGSSARRTSRRLAMATACQQRRARPMPEISPPMRSDSVGGAPRPTRARASPATEGFEQDLVIADVRLPRIRRVVPQEHARLGGERLVRPCEAWAPGQCDELAMEAHVGGDDRLGRRSSPTAAARSSSIASRSGLRSTPSPLSTSHVAAQTSMASRAAYTSWWSRSDSAATDAPRWSLVSTRPSWTRCRIASRTVLRLVPSIRASRTSPRRAPSGISPSMIASRSVRCTCSIVEVRSTLGSARSPSSQNVRLTDNPTSGRIAPQRGLRHDAGTFRRAEERHLSFVPRWS